MRRLCLLAGLSAALWATPAEATLQITSWTRVNGYWFSNGGEFTQTPNAELAAIVVTGTPSDVSTRPGTFQSFCLERSETIHAPADIVINSRAVYGSVGAEGDPISVGTSWLYSQFRMGKLPGYDYDTANGHRSSDAGILQETIWFLEGEQGSLSNDKFLNLVTAKYGNEGAKYDAEPGANGVVVLNLYGPGTFGTSKEVRWQDQLALVPEPSTLIAGALLLLPFGAGAFRAMRGRMS